MSTDQVESIVAVPHRSLHLGSSPKSHYSNSSMSQSRYSSSIISNLSDGEANSYRDINSLEYCIGDDSSVDNTYNTTLPQGDVFSGVSMNLNQTFIATSVNGSVNFWNENLSLMHKQETALEKYQTFHKNTDDGSNSLATSPDSAGRESQPSSCELSWRGSLENSGYSLSSGEMVMRNNSFCLEDQSLVIVSSLDESSVAEAVGHSALPIASNMLSTTLPDVCEKPTEKIVEESHPCLGMTFINTDNWEILTEENELTSNFLATLPDENKQGLLMTFVCEISSEDSGKGAKFPSEADLYPHFPRAITPEQSKAFVATQETDKEIYTSTPVQIIGNKIPSLPSFSESPCTGNVSSPGLNLVRQQKESVVEGLQVQKMEVNRPSNSDFSGIESEVMTRAGPQFTVPSPFSQLIWSQISPNNKHTQEHKGSAIRINPTKVISGPTLPFSTTTKMANSAQKQVNKGVGNLGMTLIQSSGHTAVDGQGNNRASPMHHHPSSNKHSSAVQCRNTRSEMAKVSPSHVVDDLTKHAGNKTSCFSSLETFPDRSGQTYLKPPLKKSMSEKSQVRSGSALGQNKPPVHKTRPRFSSDSSSSSRPPSFAILKADIHPSRTKAGNPNCTSQNKRAIHTEDLNKSTESSTRDLKKISLVAESGKSISQGTSTNETKSRFRAGLSPRRKRETVLSQSLAASHRPATLSTRQRQGPLGWDDCRISRALGTPKSMQKNPTGSRRVQATGAPSLGNSSAQSTKHQLNGSQPPQTPSRAAIMGHRPTPASKLPPKTLRPSRTLTEAAIHSELGEGGRSAQVSGGSTNKPTPLKSVLKARHISTPGKNTQSTLTAACKPATSSSKQFSSSTASPLIKTTSAKFVYVPSSRPVNNNKSKSSSCQQHQQQAAQSNQSNRPPDVVPASAAEIERKNHKIQHLKGLLAFSNCRFEAITIVLQQSLAKSDEATRQCRELSQELVNIQGELVCSVHSSERLEKEKEELRLTLVDALQKLQEQHQKDLTELEQRLHAFYQAEWDKVHLTYQEEADKCKTLMQQQVGELKSSHEVKKLELQSSHTEHLQCVKQQYEIALKELSKAQSDDLQSLENALKHVEASLSEQIQELTVEKNFLIEKLTAEENKRKEMAEMSQKDSRTLYLEQELESLKVVLDMKNKQLHQQEKKLMEMDKLTDKNVKLDETLKKVQQENEDLKARMERHAALSRQLSTEQAMLQESLQKESKVNKRLSMENEELLWKLHNGELGSPRRVSPTSTSPLNSPSHSFSLQSPHSSSSPLTPR